MAKFGGALSGKNLLDYIMAGMGLKDLLTGGGGGGGDSGRTGTFEGESSGGVSVDPRDLLARGVDTSERQMSALEGRANRPVQLRSSYVQQPPTFTGGGMPMQIGLSGYDPALANPSLQTGEGLGGEGATQEALAAIELLKGDQWKPGRG